VLALVAHPPHLFLVLLLPQRQVALLPLLQHLDSGRSLQEILHLALVVLMSLIVVSFVIELN
jgi:hypothetical protein